MADDRPDPTVPPISWCRIFQVGPPCQHLCDDCARTYRAAREQAREDTLYDVARASTDEVMGSGTYAKINAGHSDPGVQAAIKRWELEQEVSR